MRILAQVGPRTPCIPDSCLHPMIQAGNEENTSVITSPKRRKIAMAAHAQFPRTQAFAGTTKQMEVIIHLRRYRLRRIGTDGRG